MATSGNTSWEYTQLQIVNAAYRKLGYLAEGQTLSTEALANGVEALNAQVQLLVTDGMPLWKRSVSTQTPSATNQVYTVADAIKIAQVVLKDSSGTQYDLIEKSLYDFNRLPQGTNAGMPVHYTAQKTISGYTVSIWPIYSDSSTVATKTINIVYQKEFDGFFSNTNTPDFPPYWTQALVYGTAVALGPETGYPLPDQANLYKQYQEYKKMASDYGDEDGSLFIQVDRMGRR